ncbi:MAG: sterol desaturase family protein [Crocinitomicaceae bacterium]|nr:sterol desaturase family protein [Crocinitomicaceae bacterium]
MFENLEAESNILIYAVPFFVVFIFFELWIDLRESAKSYEARDTISSLTMGLGNLLINTSAKVFVLGIFWFIYDNYRLFTLDFSYLWVWIFVFFAEDFTYYWFHRISHSVRYFWASHVVHHSSKRYNLSTALRQTWTGTLAGGFLFWAWLPIMGVHPIVVGILQSTSLIYQFWIHTEKIVRLPRFIEFLFNTPSHHRVHHSSEPRYLDRNHAGILIIWDRIFRTFVPENGRPTYGLTVNIDSFNPLVIAFNEWGTILSDFFTNGLSIRNRMMYIFGPPGWSHDNSRKTSKELRLEEEQLNQSIKSQKE